MKTLTSALPILLLSLAPSVTLAANQVFADLVAKFTGIINVIVPILISLAIVLFFFHTGKGIFGDAQNSGQAKSDLKETLMWGVGIIFVMVSIWGILNLIGSEFDLVRPGFGR